MTFFLLENQIADLYLKQETFIELEILSLFAYSYTVTLDYIPLVRNIHLSHTVLYSFIYPE